MGKVNNKLVIMLQYIVTLKNEGVAGDPKSLDWVRTVSTYENQDADWGLNAELGFSSTHSSPILSLF